MWVATYMDLLSSSALAFVMWLTLLLANLRFAICPEDLPPKDGTIRDDPGMQANEPSSGPP